MPSGANCGHFPPQSFAPVTRLRLTFCNFGSLLRLTLLSTFHLRPTFPDISGSRLALSAILAPNSTQNTEHRLKTHDSNTGNIRPLDPPLCTCPVCHWYKAKRGDNLQGGVGHQPVIYPISANNSINMKNIGPRVEGRGEEAERDINTPTQDWGLVPPLW